jgi:hypothetical protein
VKLTQGSKSWSSGSWLRVVICLHLHLSLKMEAAWFSETLVACHNPEDHDVNLRRLENLKTLKAQDSLQSLPLVLAILNRRVTLPESFRKCKIEMLACCVCYTMLVRGLIRQLTEF